MYKTELIAVLPVAACQRYLLPGCSSLVETTDFLQLVTNCVEYHPRYKMEEDEHYVQLIPYVVYRSQDQIFVMQRSANASEKRLAGNLSLGIGGHIRQEDMQQDDIIGWAAREFHEEVSVTAAPTLQVQGLIYDPANPVGRVHLGICIIAHAAPSAHIAIKDEHVSGQLLSVGEARVLYDRLESWSQLVFDQLGDIMPTQDLQAVQKVQIDAI